MNCDVQVWNLWWRGPKAGDFLGENMLSEDIDYPLSAYCMEETLACGFNKERFEHLILEHPNIGLQVIKNLSRRIAWLTDHVGSMSLTNLEDRLYRVLVSVAQEHGFQNRKGLVIQFPLTHEDLSFLIGAHRVSVTRALKHAYPYVAQYVLSRRYKPLIIHTFTAVCV